MSREIKYQCIYRPTGETFEPTSIDLVNKSVCGTFDGERSYCYYSLEPNGYGDAWLREYTGLKDKNGREIYEGDFVQNERSTSLIVWSDHHQWGYKIVRGETLLINAEFPLWHEDVPIRYTCSNLEVVGDIYTNPELLEV